MTNDDRSGCAGVEPGFSGSDDAPVLPLGNAAMAAGLASSQSRMLSREEIEAQMRRAAAPGSFLDLKSRFQIALKLPVKSEMHLQDAFDMASELYEDIWAGKCRRFSDETAEAVQDAALQLCIAICELRAEAGCERD